MTTLFVHPSDERYGADRMLVEVMQALRCADPQVCWLPSDVDYPDHSLCLELKSLGMTVRHRALPIARRQNATIRGAAGILGDLARVRMAVAGCRDVSRVYLNTTAALPVAPAARSAHKQVIFHAHEIWGPMERRLFGPLLRCVHMVIAISDAVRRSLPDWIQSSTRIVPNGLPDLGDPPKLPDGPLRVLMASRWNDWKGHADLLQAWKLADRRNMHLTILGGPPIAGAAVNVPALVRDADLGGSVEIIGQVTDVDYYVAKSHVVVVPSTKPEPFSLIALEAARSARPVVANASGGISEVVVDGLTGWLVAPRSIPEWSQVFRDLERREIGIRGDAARNRFVRLYTREKFRTRLREALAYADLPVPSTIVSP